ncbi:FkbM family methyltransferase [Acinetobacter wuhouensis]|uniref:FkbM family methyltransferase n=1 Tax=Acinetobacter wuhouensis TaxID=1879050 RepID=UPI0010236A37|nr:FkbM family methyltransferase [Acinetobacter wuhouensis]RZG72226.1 FkbM family methyltransferase [Acinetobacter wuhouensis]
MDFFYQLLKPKNRTKVVDIGANPIDGEPPYKTMLDLKICEVVGFEPQTHALAILNQQKSELENYLPYVVGDGAEHQLRICCSSGMTSLFEPNPEVLQVFDFYLPLGEVLERVNVPTIRFDDIHEIQHVDYLKIDIQGGELNVFKHGHQQLKTAVAIQTEVSFMTLYQNQAGFGEIDIELRAQGFVPHCFAAVKHWPISPMVLNQNPAQPLNQLLEADLVYVRDFSKPELMNDEQLKQLAVIAHYAYRSYDLALRCVILLEERQVLSESAKYEYVEYLQTNF